MNIKELQDGYKGSIRVLLLNVNKGVTAKGAPYLSFVFQDKTGSMDAKYWNVSEEELYRYTPGMIVDASGDVLCHQKQLQFRVQKLHKVEEEVDVSEYVKAGWIPAEVLKERIYAYVEAIENPTMAALMKAIMKDYDKDFFAYPAATRNHHDFYGGLATHVLGMLDLAKQLCMLYPMLNRDLLYCGVLLHDIGKTVELSGAIVTEYTTQGKLLGHISIMQAEVAAKAKELGLEGEEVLLLRHMILSHHGVYEYGSPVLPMIPEAEMLHMIDNIDARMQTMQKALEPIAPGDFTSRIFALENRSFYKSKYDKTNGK